MTEKDRAPFFFNPLRSRILLVFLLAHLGFALVLGEIYAFAPDEGGYLGIFNELYSRHFSLAGHLGWAGTIPIWYLHIIYLPAKLLTYLGLPSYFALRVESFVLGSLCIYFLLCIYKTEVFRNRFTSLTLFVGVITPSIFLWNTLSLREEFIYLAFSLISLGVYFIFSTRKYLGTFLLFLGNFILMNTKSYLLIVVIATFILFLFIQLWRNRKFHVVELLLLVCVVTPLVINPSQANQMYMTVTAQFSHSSTYVLEEPDSASAGTTGTTGTTGTIIYPGTAVVALADSIRHNPHAPFSILIRFLGLNEKIQSLAKSAEVALSKEKLTNDHSSRMYVKHAHLGDPVSVVEGSGRFLFEPFPFFDNGSFFLNVLSYESFFWWFLYFMFGLTFWQRFRNRDFDELATFLVVFVFGFIIFSAITEINVGTLVRHRSVLLFPMLYFIVTQRRRSPQGSTSPSVSA